MLLIALHHCQELSWALCPHVGLQRLDGAFNFVSVGKVFHFKLGGRDQALDDERIDPVPNVLEQESKPRDIFEESPQRLAGQLRASLLHAEANVLGAELDEMTAHCLVVLKVAHLLALAKLVERGLRDVEIALLDQLRHLSIEERQQQSTNVRSIYIGVGHDDHVMVAKFVDVEVVAAFNPAPERRDQRPNLGAGKHFFETRAFDV